MRTRKFTMVVTVLLVSALAAAGNALAGAVVTGKVNFTGTPPAPSPINFGAEKACAQSHGDKQPVDETVVVNANNTLKGAVVFVNGVTGTFEAPKDPLLIDQKGCLFVPHVSAVMAGQPIAFQNSDPVLHNVRAISKKGQNMNVAQPIQGMKTNKTFKEPETGIQLKCDVHFWMKGYLHVFGHPFFATTGDDGSFTIKDLPAGTYTLELWHEKYGSKSQEITVADGETKTADFSIGE